MLPGHQVIVADTERYTCLQYSSVKNSGKLTPNEEQIYHCYLPSSHSSVKNSGKLTPNEEQIHHCYQPSPHKDTKTHLFL